MISTREKYKKQIVKYLQKEANADERILVESWIAKSPKNKKLFESYRGLFILTKKEEVIYDPEIAWEKVKSKIMANPISHASTTPIISISSKRLSNKVIYAVSGVAAALLLTIGFVSVMKQDVMLTQYTSGYEVSDTYTLPDGSIMNLNQNTTIKYPAKFNKRTREISIFGEAFFEIKPDSKKPFIIHSAGINIKVLGTKFNVEAYPGQETVKVVVSSGTVLVYPNNVENGEDLGHKLTNGEIATYNKRTGLITKDINDDLNVTSWKTGELIFRETPLFSVFKALEDKYNKKFIVEDKKLLDKRLTARFEDQSLKDALDALALIFEMEYDNLEDHVRVY